MKYLKQIYVIFSLSGIIFLNGCVFGWSAPSVPKLLDPRQTTLDRALTEGEVSFVTTACLLSTLTYLSSGVLINKIGRKKVLIISTGIHFISWVLVYAASSFTMLTLGKLLSAQGFGLGYHSTIVYLSEISSKKVRGYALTSCCLYMNVGLLTMFCVGPFVTLAELAIMPATVAAFVFLALLFVPESPVYLLHKGDQSGASQVMTFLNRRMSELQTKQEAVLLKIHKPESRMATVKELLFVRKNLKSLIIACGLNFGQQACGSLPVLFYATSIFEKAGSSVTPHVATIIIGVIQLVSVLLSNLLVELLGRRPLYLMSCAFTAFTNLTLGFSFYLDEDNPLKQQLSWLPLASTVIYIIAYTIGFGALTTTLVGELLDPKVRPLGSALALTTENITSIFFVFTFSSSITALGVHNVFWIYASVCVCAFVFVFVCVPETKGKSEEEIQELLMR